MLCQRLTLPDSPLLHNLLHSEFESTQRGQVSQDTKLFKLG